MKIRIGILFLFLSITGGYSSSPGFIDSLTTLIYNNENTNDEQKMHYFLQMCYSSIDVPEKAVVYGNEALTLAQKIGNKKQQAFAYGYIGRALSNVGNYVDAIEAFTNSASLFNEMNLSSNEAFALASIGVIFSKNGDLTNSIRYYRDALNVFKSKADTLQIATSFLNIGEGYRLAGLIDSAQIYYLYADSMFRKIDNSNETAKDNLAIISGNLGIIYAHKGNYSQAQKKLFDAYSYFFDINDFYRASVYVGELGKLNIIQKNYQTGENLLHQSLDLAKNESNKEQIRDMNLQLSDYYQQIGKHNKALKHYKCYKAYDDTLKNVENVRKMEQMQSLFQLNKKDDEIESLNRINILQRKLAYFLSAGVVFFLVFVFLLINSNRKISRAVRVISHQKDLVETKEQEKALLLRELNHRVKNNLQMVASLLSLHARQLKGHPAADALLAGKYRVEALTLIHQKLYRADVDTVIDITAYIKELADNLILNFGHDFELVLKLEPFLMKIDKAIPLGLVVNELITNSLKYGRNADGESLLKIELKKYTDEVFIHIRDKGVGLPDNFDLSKTHSFGLKLVHSLIKQLGGVIEYKSEAGTHWIICLDIEKIS